MPIDVKVLEEFLKTHESSYIGKYRFHSNYQIDDSGYKNHYYMLDSNFRQIDIYVEIHAQDHVTYTFSEDLHEQEQIYIVKDAINRYLRQAKYKASLHYRLYETYLKNISNVSEDLTTLEPIDYCHILNYMKYHKGENQETIDEFYKVFIPGLKRCLKNKNYSKFMDSLNLLFKIILYEYEWDGTSSKYLDTEYQYHFYYIRDIIKMVYENLNHFYKEVPDALFEAIHQLCLSPRFAFTIMTDFGSLVLSQVEVTQSLILALKSQLALTDKNDKNSDGNLVFSYIYYLFYSDYEQYYDVVLRFLRYTINNMLTFANHDLDLALGNVLVKEEGYQVLLDLFHEDYNTFVFTCFPIETFPDEMRPKVREELVTAIQFFAARMENDNYRLSSFEQVMNINRLLMDNFKEWGR